MNVFRHPWTWVESRLTEESEPFWRSNLPAVWAEAVSRSVLIAAAAALLLTVAAPWPSAADELRTVERVIDGDTLVREGGERVRLIGVDTPETVDPRSRPGCQAS